MRHLKSRFFLILFVLGISATFSWGQAEYTIKVQKAENGVQYLTDGRGMSLYYYTLDTNGQSACNGSCVDKWPIFYTPSVSVPPSLDANDFGTITRADGVKETTYKGWPLYYWVQDKNPGEIKGEGVGKVWYLLKVPAYTVMIGTNKKVGNYLVDANGNSLYYYTKDSAGQSACDGNCVKNWPVFSASSFSLPSALNPSDFGTITRSDGTTQATFKGFPLYYWVKDAARGDLNGQGIGNVWYVVDPAKFNPAQASSGS